MNKCIKVVLNKVYDIDKKQIKDINKENFKLDMNKAIEIIKDANLSACHACNKSSEMWKEYYFNRQWEVEQLYNNIDKNILEEEINNEYNKRVKNTKDKSKLNNEKYISKIKNSSEKYIKNKHMKDLQIQISKLDKERYGKTYQNVIQEQTKLIMKDYNTSNVGCLDQQLVQTNWKRDLEGILNYEIRIPQYKKDTPYYFHNKSYNLSFNDGYFVELSMFSKLGYEKYNLKNGTSLKFKIDKLDNNKKSIINKIIKGIQLRDEIESLKKIDNDKANEKLKIYNDMVNRGDIYKQGSAQINISNKGKIELTMSYTFESKIKKILDRNRILGIDLGINKVAVMSIYDSLKEDYDYFSWKSNVIDGEELIKFRQKYYNMRRNLSISSKQAGEGRCGHGYNTKMKCVNNVRDKIARFADTYNHKISKYIVNYALNNNCGIIQMEDLTKATAEVNNRMLKDWSYYDLQNKIEYKAKELGIEVIKINPQYTSKRCNKCGCIHVDNRDCKNNQEKFECQICGHKDNADINASRNIAMPNIDNIIKNTEILHNENKAS